jgi:mRNA interferase RelE/StbE
MSYWIRFHPRAHKEFLGLDKALRDRIGSRLSALAENPRPHGSERLTGKVRAFRRLRVGDYRVCYTVDDKGLAVTLVEVGHRSRVYRDLDRAP